MKLRLTLLLWVVALTYGAGATAIYNNLDSTTVSWDGVCEFPGTLPACFGPLADSFSMGRTTLQLTRIGVLLKGTSDGGRTTVELYSDHGGAPGADLLEVGTISDSQLSSTYKEFFFSVARFRLAASTRYWIELSDSRVAGETSADWGYCLEACQSDLGVPGEFWAAEGDTASGWRVFPNSLGPYQMEVDVSLGRVGTPEPGTLVLLGLAVIVVWRRYER